MDLTGQSHQNNTFIQKVVKLKLPIIQYPITSGYRVKGKQWDHHFDDIKGIWSNYKTDAGIGEHDGYDFTCPIGTKIQSCIEGKILKLGYENPDNYNQGFGLRIIQIFNQNKEEWLLYYGHLSNISVIKGEEVKINQYIANSGNTGHSTAAHLHIEVRNGKTLQQHPITWVL